MVPDWIIYSGVGVSLLLGAIALVLVFLWAPGGSSNLGFVSQKGRLTMSDPSTGIQVEFLPGGPVSNGAGLSSPALRVTQAGVNIGMTALMQAWSPGASGAGNNGSQSLLVVNDLSKDAPFPGASSNYLGYLAMQDGAQS